MGVDKPEELRGDVYSAPLARDPLDVPSQLWAFSKAICKEKMEDLSSTIYTIETVCLY